MGKKWEKNGKKWRDSKEWQENILVGEGLETKNNGARE